jgi:hypothetical protein
LPRINTEFHGKDRSRATEKKKKKYFRHGISRQEDIFFRAGCVSDGRLNKRGQVSFSALTIFYSWFGLTAEKET